jgi:hypothetical protein
VEGREVHEAKNGVGAKTIAARDRGRGLQSVNFGSETSARKGGKLWWLAARAEWEGGDLNNSLRHSRVAT